MERRGEKATARAKVSREYTYRRELSASELIPAIGAGLAVGLAAFYVARLFIQRTPIVPGPLEPADRLEPRRRTGTRTGDDRAHHRRDRGAAAEV